MAVVVAVGCLEAGSRASDMPNAFAEESIFNYVIAAMAWPIIGAAGIVFLPFYGLYRLGKHLRTFRG